MRILQKIGATTSAPLLLFFCREERVRFWSDPDTELKLAQGAHQTVFRMGVDWGRLMPIEPVDGIDNAVCLTVICSTPCFYSILCGCFLGEVCHLTSKTPLPLIFAGF
jgi:hypothetical protein